LDNAVVQKVAQKAPLAILLFLVLFIGLWTLKIVTREWRSKIESDQQLYRPAANHHEEDKNTVNFF
jgi:hypothetical protein